MSQSKDTPPDCFGDLEIVFPLADDGLRHTPAPCLQCTYKTECLRAGLKGDGGLKVRGEKLDRSYDSGMIGFMERWSKKKVLERRKKNSRKFFSRWRISKSDPRESN